MRCRAWTRDGVPKQPGAWLTTAARNKALERLRHEVTLRRKLPLLVEPATVDPHDPADLDWPAYPSNAIALWELHARVTQEDLPPAK
ncbi:hypothetical protein BH10ACT10_BH10ACT10_00320 [soil metagenome]